MVATASEIRAHLGVGFAPFCRAHLGRLCEIEAIVVTPPKPVRRVGREFNAFDGIVIQVPVEKLDKNRLVELAREAAELAELPEVRTWASSVFSRAGRQGAKLDTQTALAETLLAEAKRSAFFARNYGALTRTMHFAAGMVATGVHVTLVAHGDNEVLTRLLSAVYVDGEWRYADPAAASFGAVRAFQVEETAVVPHLTTPEEVAEEQARAEREQAYVEKLKLYEQELVAYQARVQALEEEQKQILLRTQAELQAISQQLESTDLAPATRQGLTTGQKVLIAGAAVAATYVVWRLVRAEGRIRELEKVVEKPRKRGRRKARRR